MKKIMLLICLLIAANHLVYAQYTHADTLRGTYGPARSWWDALKYDLHVTFNLKDSTISGFNTIQYKAINKGSIMQIDLQEPLLIDSIAFKHQRLVYKKDGNAYFIQLPQNNKTGDINEITIVYHGKPRIAVRAPWDGGVSWKRDHGNHPWISISCQGLGASVWYPCKDHQADEPDSAELHITAPSDLVSVGNGRLRNKIENGDGTTTYSWAVTSPINSYCIIPSIGKYTHWREIYKGEKGDLDMDYWVLEQNLEKARKQFRDAPRMMKAFEYWFGPYPFYEDGYKLVDAPYLGMEHQSATAYGNGYQNGYKGIGDLSGSGWGLKWDFIIVHESGHEWFANNITSKDIADMWVHEGFADYSETLFTEYYYGKQAGTAYVTGIRSRILNDIPIIGPYGVNKEGSGYDMYYKAGNVIHTIRQVINNDEKFRMILRNMNKKFYHQTVTTKQIENFISQQSGIDFSKVFDQYLRTINIPTLEYKIQKKLLSYRWTNCIHGFNMPVRVYLAGNKSTMIYPAEAVRKIKISENELKVDENFYIYVNKL